MQQRRVFVVRSAPQLDLRQRPPSVCRAADTEVILDALGGRSALSAEVQSVSVVNEPNDLLKRVLEEVLDSRRALSEGIEEFGVRRT